MKTLVVALVGMVFLAGTSLLVVAQAPPAEKKAPAKAEAPKAEKKADAPKAAKKADAPKAAVKTASGAAKTVGADIIVVAGKEKGKDAEWTIGIDAKTKFRKGGKDITPADVKAGDRVTVRFTEDKGKAVAQSVTVSVPPAAKKDDAAKKTDAPKKAAAPKADAPKADAPKK